jgi:hypothetical protein
MQGESDELCDPGLVVCDEHERLTVQIADPPWASRLRETGQHSDLQAVSNTLQLQWLLQLPPRVATPENGHRAPSFHITGVTVAL